METKNMTEYEIIELDGMAIREFHPMPDGQGLPTQVHLTFHPRGFEEMIMVVRLKSKRATQELIDALETHRDSVWPPKKDT